MLSGANIVYISLGFVAFLIAYLLRALRFHGLLGRRIGKSALFSVICIHNSANEIMPAFTGEFSYVILLKKLHGVAAGKGIASLVVARVFDIAVISLFFIAASANVKDAPDIIMGMIWIVAAFAIVIITMLFGLVRYGSRFLGIVKRTASMVGASRSGLFRYISRKSGDVVRSFGEMGLDSVAWEVAIISLLIWAFSYLATYLLLRAFGVYLGVSETIIVISLTSLLPLLPVRGVLGFGVTEATMSVLLIVFGVAKDFAIAASFGIHIVGLVFVFLLGAYGTWRVGIKEK